MTNLIYRLLYWLSWTSMYRNTELIEDDLVRLCTKYEMIIFTNKGEILNEPNFGRFTTTST
jgi:hypothetical protein